MNVSIDIRQKDINGMLRQIKAWEFRKTGKTRLLIAETLLAIEKTAKESLSEQGQGRWYRNRGPGRGDHQASAPGAPPATDTGRLRADIRTDLRELVRLAGEVGTSVAYGRYLEFGTATLAARPWLKPAYDAHIEGFFKKLEKMWSTA